MEIEMEKEKNYYKNGNIKFEGEYLNNKKWNGKLYDLLNNIIYELKNGKGLIKNIIIVIILYLSVNIYMEITMEKLKNIIIMVY